MDTILPSQPISDRDLIKRSLTLYRISFKRVILMAALLSVIVFIPRLLSFLIGQDLFKYLSPLSPHRLWFILIDLAAMVFFIAIVWRMNCILHDQHEPIIEDFRVAGRKFLLVFVATLVQCGIIFAVAMIIFGIQILLNSYHLLFNQHLMGMIVTFLIFGGQFILTLYVATLFFFLVPLIAIENKGVFFGLEKSVLLVWNHWWRVFYVQLTPWFCYFILLLIIKIVFNIEIHIYFVEQNTHSFSSTIFNMILFALFIPWVAALLLLQLKELEVRRELQLKKHKRHARKN